MKMGLALGFLAFVTLGQSACRKPLGTVKVEPQQGAYDSEPDWSDSQKIIPLGYQQAQGKRIVYQYCVWCHADATPAGPSNRSSLTTVPALLDDGSVLNSRSDEYMFNIITLGGSAMGKSAMMPAYGRTLLPDEVRSVIAFTRAVANPPYQQPRRPLSQYSAK